MRNIYNVCDSSFAEVKAGGLMPAPTPTLLVTLPGVRGRQDLRLFLPRQVCGLQPEADLQVRLT